MNDETTFQADVICIGAGISGAVLAERYAAIGKKVLVLEKRDHIGGNCFDFVNEAGILVSKYGPHLFHTNFEDVWKYVQQFGEWYPFEIRTVASVDGQIVPVPVNITTVNTLFHLNIQTPQEMKRWLDENQVHVSQPKNGKEAAEARVGRVLYEKMFKNYTKKQWDKFPEELSPEVLNRIPVRTDFEDRYFTDKYQALPKLGYTKIFERMLSHHNITVRLNTDFFDVRNDLKKFEKLFYTGPIDQYFDFKHSLKEKLEYRSLRFEHETLDQEFYQSNPIINYPSLEVPYTRVVEYKQITGQKSAKTTIVREYSTDQGEPFYPVPNPRNQEIYEKYQQEAEKLQNIHFVGRLANYKYFNMDQAFKNALDLFYSLETAASKADQS